MDTILPEAGRGDMGKPCRCGCGKKVLSHHAYAVCKPDGKMLYGLTFDCYVKMMDELNLWTPTHKRPASAG